jgi:hypothetical protein
MQMIYYNNKAWGHLCGGAEEYIHGGFLESRI